MGGGIGDMGARGQYLRDSGVRRRGRERAGVLNGKIAWTRTEIEIGGKMWPTLWLSRKVRVV